MPKPSILPEYKYDIFISYRQNDNKYDGWVTEFVDNLQKELDATLKNPVSIYFDENPHDGLQDTHVVDESLAKKLKCLIFIPIISQTYCDTGSFAWQHEFLAFNEIASGDELGMNITLANGNIASRILPIRIHDIDADDQQKFEDVTGSPLRSIDFIYKEAGVNRSLKPSDDKKDNLNATSYRNQMNKVAHALKDLGTSVLRKREGNVIEPRPTAAETIHAKNPSLKKGLYIGMAAILLMIIGYWGYTNFFQSTEEKATATELAKTIAVLPFSNTKPDPDTDFLGFAIANQIIGDLNYNKNVIVRPASSIRQYDQEVIDAIIVADGLKVNYVLTGTYLMQAGIIRLDIELIEAKGKSLIWRDNIEVDYHNAFELQDIVAKKVVDGLQAQFTQTELSRIGKDIPQNSLAYEYYLRGVSYPLTKEGGALAIEMLNKSIQLDSNFAPAYTELGDRYHELAIYEKLDPILYARVEKLHLKAISMNEDLLSALNSLSMFYTETKRIEKAVFLARKVLSLSPNNAEAHFNLSYIYRYAGMDQEAIIEGEKAITLNPGNPGFRSLSLSCYNIGDYKKAHHILDIIEPSDWVDGMRGFLFFAEGKERQAIEVFDKIISKDPENFWGLIAATYKASIKGDKLLGLELMLEREQANMIDGEPIFYSAIDYAILGDKEGCNRLLQKAVDAGYFNYPTMLTNPNLKSMQADPEFQLILNQAKTMHEAFKTKFF